MVNLLIFPVMETMGINDNLNRAALDKLKIIEEKENEKQKYMIIH